MTRPMTIWRDLPFVIKRKTRYARVRGSTNRPKYISGIFFGGEYIDIPIVQLHIERGELRTIAVENLRGQNYGYRNSLTNVKKKQAHSKKKQLRRKIV